MCWLLVVVAVEALESVVVAVLVDTSPQHQRMWNLALSLSLLVPVALERQQELPPWPGWAQPAG